LKDSRQQLEERVAERTKELAEAKQRFEIALRGSPIMVFTQDRDMRFTWVHNPPSGINPAFLIGKTDSEILPPEAADPFMAAKKRAMERRVADHRNRFRPIRPEPILLPLTEALHDGAAMSLAPPRSPSRSPSGKRRRTSFACCCAS
jgi:PAS domain-containing protein